MDNARSAITIGPPTITPLKTESMHGDWVTTGMVTFTILQGGNPAFGMLEIPYRDAASVQGALAQSLGVLEQVVAQLSRILENLRTEAAAAAATVAAPQQAAVVPAVAAAA